MGVEVTEDFDTPGGGDLTTSTNAVWTFVSGSIVINDGNDTARVFNANSYYHTVDLGDPDAYLKGSILAPSSSDNDQAVAVRIQDVDNYIAFSLNNSITMRLIKVIAGAVTQLDTVSYTSLDVIEIRPSGTDIAWYKNDVLIDTIEVLEFATETKQGLLSRGGGSTSSYLKYYETGTISAGSSSTTSGTSVPTQTEADYVAGGDTIIATLTNDTYLAAGTGPIGSIANTQALIDGIVSAQSEANGFNAERSNIAVTDLVRTSDTVATLTLPALASFNITATETLTQTIPAEVLVTSGTPVVSTPTFTITAVVAIPTFTSAVLKNNTGTILINEVNVTVDVYDDSTGVLVLHKTGETTDGSGILTFADAALSEITEYTAVYTFASGDIGVAKVTTS